MGGGQLQRIEVLPASRPFAKELIPVPRCAGELAKRRAILHGICRGNRCEYRQKAQTFEPAQTTPTAAVFHVPLQFSATPWRGTSTAQPRIYPKRRRDVIR